MSLSVNGKVYLKDLKCDNDHIYGRCITTGSYPQTFLVELKTELPNIISLDNKDYENVLFVINGTLEKRKANDKVFNYIAISDVKLIKEF